MEDKNKPDQTIELTQLPEDENIIELTDEIKFESEEIPEVIEYTDNIDSFPREEEAGEEAPIELYDLEDDFLKDDIEFNGDMEMEPILEESILEDESEINESIIDQDTEDDSVDFIDINLESEIDILEDLSETEKPDIALESEEAPYKLEQLIADVTEDLQKEPDENLHKEAFAQESIPVSSDQIEEALERVIKKMFSDKIENILTEVIEKVVAKEIKKLKSIMLED